MILKCESMSIGYKKNRITITTNYFYVNKYLISTASLSQLKNFEHFITHGLTSNMEK